jgi:hypothetical protein
VRGDKLYWLPRKKRSLYHEQQIKKKDAHGHLKSLHYVPSKLCQFMNKLNRVMLPSHMIQEKKSRRHRAIAKVLIFFLQLQRRFLHLCIGKFCLFFFGYA